MPRLFALLLLGISMTSPVLLLAQVETARIIGSVKDQTGAVVPNAAITMLNTATNISYSTRSKADGSYESIPLHIGSYVVSAELAGFKRVVHEGIVLQIQQTALVDIVMEVGQVSQDVQVTGATPLLTVNEATQGQVIDNRKVVDLPLNGRDYVQLGLLSSGTNQPSKGARTGGFSASGMRSTQNNYLLDGVDNNNAQIAYQGLQAEAVKPNVDAIQEFKVMTNSFSAEYGRATGAIVNVTMKSGTNQVHGTAFEFIRNEKLDAKNFFDLPNRPKPPFKRNQYGFSAGGPIIPNKTFFFGDYEASRIRESSTFNNTLPTPAMVGGDFSQLLPGTLIYDPKTYDAATGLRMAFPGNIIPRSRFDPIGAKLASFYPAPNKPGLNNNYLANPPLHTDLDHFDVKVDHTFSSKDSVYTRVSYQKTVLPLSTSLPAPAFGSGRLSTTTNTGNNYMLAYNHVFTPAFILSLKAAWNRLYTDIEPPRHFYNQELGLKGVATTIPGMAQFTVAGYTTLGIGSTTPNLIGSQNRQLVDDFTWIHDKHTVKFGINFSWLQSSLINPQDSQGVFAFDGSFTRNPKTAREGNAVADLLLGNPFQAQVSTWAYMNQRAPFFDFYAQDEWRVTPRLTLNAGVRYELHLPWVETRNLWANFDTDTDPAHPALVLAKNGSREDRATIRTDANDVGPRFGFAYRATDKTVVRAGYGIYYAQYEGFGGAQYLEVNPPYTYKAVLSTDRVNPTLSLAQGLPAGTVSPQNAANIQTSSYDRNLRHGYAQQWSFSVQRELPGEMLLDAGYYANTAHKLMRRTEGNYALPGPGDVNSRRRYHAILVPPDNVLVGPLAGTFRQEATANSNFHSAQVKLEKRLSRGLSLLGSYMFSKTISDGRGESGAGGISNSLPQNPLDYRAERSLADEHRPHRFVMSYVYELPFGRGKPFLPNPSRLLNGLLGGWTTAGILTITSGQLVSLTVRGNPSNTGGPTGRTRSRLAFKQRAQLAELVRHYRLRSQCSFHVRQCRQEFDRRSGTE
jgi:Outer membrane receptor proteins, mostly Fe transport